MARLRRELKGARVDTAVTDKDARVLAAMMTCALGAALQLDAQGDSAPLDALEHRVLETPSSTTAT